MAKMKQFAVDITYTVTETIYVTARKPSGAAEKAMTDEAYNSAHAYECDEESPCYGRTSGLPKGANVVKIREV